MPKISIEEYFGISRLLEKTNKDDYERYKDSREFDRQNKDIEQLKHFYDKNDSKDISNTAVIGTIRFWLKVMIFFLTFLSSLYFFKDEININLHLIVSIFVPLVFTIYSLGTIIWYAFKYPDKPVNSILNNLLAFLSKILKKRLNYNPKHSHVLKMYSWKIFQELTLTYMFTLLVFTFVAAGVIHIKFTYQSTGEISVSDEKEIVSKLSSPWHKIAPSAIPTENEILEAYTTESDLLKKPQRSWSRFILLSMICWVIIPRILLLVVVNYLIGRRIRDSLISQGKTFFEVIKYDIEIRQDSNLREPEEQTQTQHIERLDDKKTENKNEVLASIPLSSNKTIEIVQDSKPIASTKPKEQDTINEDTERKVKTTEIKKVDNEIKKSTLREPLELTHTHHIERLDDQETENKNELLASIPIPFSSNKRMDIVQNTEPINSNEQKEDSNKNFILYYKIRPEDYKKIEFDFLKDQYFKEKDDNKYSFGLFKQKEQDKMVVPKLKNLILIFTRPECDPDETFKDFIKKLLNNNEIKQIWIAPLIEKNDEKYRLSNKGDFRYLDWQYQINQVISNDKVRLYNER